ncbi:MAG: DUF551 domain-containing protein [Lachnospiraceae bacterium]|nr:DUF551 domain-containing protein [Lachnospiraceae bacterium]
MNNMEFIDGMNKAWDLAFRLIGEDEDILLKIFGTAEIDEIISNNEPQYALKKLEEYDNENRKEYLPDTNDGNKDGWIPVDERLPEDKQQVLVTNWDYCVFLARYDENEKRFIDIRNGLVLPLILAWMPLPKPYREKGE